MHFTGSAVLNAIQNSHFNEPFIDYCLMHDNN
jgi:hypothetical protein